MTNSDPKQNAGIIHASCVAVSGKGLLILGDSGCGKSDLALRLIDDGAQLVGDDQIILRRDKKVIFATAPEKLRGLLEVHGVGIVKMPFLTETELRAAVCLVRDAAAIERLPQSQFYEYDGVKIPLTHLYAFEASSPVKARLCCNKSSLDFC